VYVVGSLHHALEVVGDDAHGHPHGWSMKKILMSSTLCDEPQSTKNLEVWALHDVLV
jgi:hypothetical protein